MYLYHINYPPEKKALCEMEMQCLFSIKPESHYVLSHCCFEAKRSVFFKARLEILCEASSTETLLDQIEKLQLSCESFKVTYLKVEDNKVNYELRLRLVKEASQKILGIGTMKEAKVEYGITYVNHTWYFGILTKDHQSWQRHQKKPQSYSQSLSASDARSLVNIASLGNVNCRLIDPCCGVGTVVLEALSLGHQIAASEILKGVCWKANRNLEYFGYPKLVQNEDIHDLRGHYDVAVLDIPYNLYSNITKEMQQSLICQCARIADELVLISYENLEEMLNRAGFVICQQCQIKKIQFSRTVYRCIKS